MARRGRNPNLFIRLRIKDSIENRTREGGTQAPFIMGTRGAHSIRRWYNNAPYFSTFTVDENTGYINSDFVFEVDGGDADGDTLSYSWSITGHGSPTLSLSDDHRTATFTATAAARGDYTVTVSISDGTQTISQTKTVSVLNRAPTLSEITISPETTGNQDTVFTASVTGTDPDLNEAITYSWSIRSPGGSLSDLPGSGNTVTFDPPDETYGQDTIYVSGSDQYGGTSSIKEANITVVNRPPTISSFTLTINGNIANYVASASQTDSIVFEVVATDPDGTGPLTYVWTSTAPDSSFTTSSDGSTATYHPGGELGDHSIYVTVRSIPNTSFVSSNTATITITQSNSGNQNQPNTGP